MYHFHIYFTAEQQQEAIALYDSLQNRLLSANLGKIHSGPVGPHPVASFVINVAKEHFDYVYTMLGEIHGNLTVMIHPLTGDDIDDHREENISWIGKPFVINRDVFRR